MIYMTNEEVVEELNADLKEVNFWLERYKSNGEVCEKREIRKVVLEAAIKALEQEPFINKPCISEGVCHEDKIQVLDKIRAEIERERSFQRAIDEYDIATGLRKALEIIDKYNAERSDKG